MSRLTILYSSEHHASIWPAVGPDGRAVGGLERRATLARRERRRGGAVLLLDSGDVLYGGTASAAFGGLADIVGMNAAGYDAMGAGNHDFDLGCAYLRDIAARASFPILSSNVRAADGPVLPESALLDTPAGLVLVASVLSADVFSKFNPATRGEFRWLEPVPALERLVGRRAGRAGRGRRTVGEGRGARGARGPDVVVVITHQTTADDLRLAAAFPAADVIVGGHVNGFRGLLAPGAALLAPGAAAPVAEYEGPGPVVVKATRQGRHLGHLELEVLPGRAVRARAALHEVGWAIPPDPEVAAALAPYRERLDRRLADLPYLDGNLVRTRRGRAEVARLVAAALRWRLGCDVALQLVGGVFSGHLGGVTRYRDVIDVLPYRGRTVRLRLGREEIAACLEHGLRQAEQLAGTLVQAAGVAVAVDPRRLPGERVVSMEFESPCGADGRWSVATQEYLARGGAGFRLDGPVEDGGVTPIDCLAAYLELGPAVPAPPLVYVSDPPPAPWAAGERQPEFVDGQTVM